MTWRAKRFHRAKGSGGRGDRFARRRRRSGSTPGFRIPIVGPIFAIVWPVSGGRHRARQPVSWSDPASSEMIMARGVESETLHERQEPDRHADDADAAGLRRLDADLKMGDGAGRVDDKKDVSRAKWALEVMLGAGIVGRRGQERAKKPGRKRGIT